MESYRFFFGGSSDIRPQNIRMIVPQNNPHVLYYPSLNLAYLLKLDPWKFGDSYWKSIIF